MRKNTRNRQILFLTRLAMFLAIEAIICFVPFLGSIKIGPVVATLAMIPVCLGACLFGPLFGTIMGFFAGLFSFIWWTFIAPGDPTALMFTPWNAFNGTFQTSYWTLAICFGPRILTGVASGYAFKGLKSRIKNPYVPAALACIVGSIINTFLVLFGTYFLWGKQYALIAGMDYQALIIAIWTIVVTNGIFEVVVSGIIGTAVGGPLYNYAKNR